MQIEFDLGNPGYTLLHRAGLAGLWMTLKQLQREVPIDNRPQRFRWETDTDDLLVANRGFTLQWENNDLSVLDWFLKWSFQIADGLIYLKGLDSTHMSIESQVIIHKGILGTLLQHNKTHKATGTQTKSFQLEDDKPPVLVKYKSLQSYVYQEFAKNLCDKKGNWLNKPMKVAGWLNPGAAVKHIAFTSSTSFEETPEQAFILLFAPVACYYFLLSSTLRDKRAQYALIIPEITDLEKYANYRQNSHLREASYKDFFASGLGDAGLRFLTYETTAELANKFGLERCQVLTLGTVAWASQQKTRTDLYVVEASEEVCENYQLCCNWFSNRIRIGKDGSFVASSFARELIANNLAKNKPWYAGISDKVNNNQLFEKLTYERGGLYQMTKKAKYDERDKLFVEVCHEAIKFTYGKISKNTKSGEDINSKLDRATIRMRTGLSRCKSADSFREFITDFWSRAGRLPILQKHWIEMMEFITNQQQWKKARDLALLALASYKKDDTKSNQNEVVEEDDLIDIGL